ncbi:hypothetical protein PC118_g19099 [Phytophthora cactorum]|uniref:Uncharacterized protein n=1 Tax=Phytophthora cactorum TaxID=29920 RepID=A0A8T0ZEU7_9STRA|nr:hypothetical protein PC111_g18087 [Phytophthora cactorum]KAG2861351.1 hypothetical protein PC113_g7246 [Phytophthora cactorum]KAG2933356.1 hypothetical protein PC115_g5516 [Phytophthora cactorum]KAG2966573.1 hypothetical protein PC118_g19099 [Phytophthora cactorum]KAG3028965.1 hypothetical protein PC119_g6834 [Phytophthora cactorum]
MSTSRCTNCLRPSIERAASSDHVKTVQALLIEFQGSGRSTVRHMCAEGDEWQRRGGDSAIRSEQILRTTLCSGER